MKAIQLMSHLASEGRKPEVLLWVGCAGSFDPRGKKVTKAFATILQNAGVEFAVLGNEETCTGDPARRAGNEFLYQMQAIQNVEVLNGYEVETIVATCPHCFNTIKNEYPQFGGHYEVLHHTQYLEQLIEEGRLKIVENGPVAKQNVTYHDSCYIGRVNGMYQIPRQILDQLKVDLHEMARCKSNGLCCGAGGAQMFKEDEPGDRRINAERMSDILETKSNLVAANCPFCITMLEDGITAAQKEEDIMVLDLAELIVQNNNW